MIVRVGSAGTVAVALCVLVTVVTLLFPFADTVFVDVAVFGGI